jgi:hypothetical protein
MKRRYKQNANRDRLKMSGQKVEQGNQGQKDTSHGVSEGAEIVGKCSPIIVRSCYLIKLLVMKVTGLSTAISFWGYRSLKGVG